MNKAGILSLLMVILSVAFFFVMRGPEADLTLAVYTFGGLSILGIIFALFSKKWIPAITGTLLNGAVLVFAFFLLLAKGIGG
ncbi:hypothetical protein V6B33_02640 [Mangrovibacillus sp. Mu-81]|jgi:hypothetical protein|uniref:hypothetical protein n=1 Tax=Mangrovibacillus sp. Mu-81 TaxID=3121478 RepID=UPI002FE4EF12